MFRKLLEHIANTLTLKTVRVLGTKFLVPSETYTVAKLRNVQLLRLVSNVRVIYVQNPRVKARQTMTRDRNRDGGLLNVPMDECYMI